MAGAALFLGGCALFLFESQTFGLIAMALAVGCGFLWAHSSDDGDDIAEDLRHRSRLLVTVGACMVAAGWIVFFAVWEELGLLLVVLGALPLALTLLGARRDAMGSPVDGPPFGETGP